ncbi:MAG TPA: hypothetical protein VJ436_04500 [Anaerolineales bacterium]|nr:hypothetical protein [Anaerolineales bacterium]
MIDWINLAGNALWILGCALFLAALSFASWEASLYGEKFRTRLRGRGVQTAISVAGILFCIGLAIVSDSALEVIVWSALALAFAGQLTATLRTTWSQRGRS